MRTVAAACVGVLTLLVALAGGAAHGSAPAAQEPGLKVGDTAPDFSLAGSDGRTYTLAEHKGVRPVVLAWFPRTPIKD